MVADALQLTVEELKQLIQEANEAVASEGIYINGVKIIMTATGEVIIVDGMCSPSCSVLHILIYIFSQ